MPRRNFFGYLGSCSETWGFALESRGGACSDAAEYTWEKRVERIIDGVGMGAA